MTVAEPQALQAMVAHHRALEEGVQTRAALVGDAQDGDARAVAELVAYLAGEVLPHAQAEERTVYRSARTHDNLVQTLDEMIGEHGTLAAATARLAESPDSADARSEAQQLAALFSAHVAKENEIILPAIAADAAVDLDAVLVEMQRLFQAAQGASEGPEDSEGPGTDPTQAVVSLLVKATTALAKAGEADHACRLAAAGWAALHESRPELAVRVTAALHGLARQTSEPVTLTAARRPGEQRGGEQRGGEQHAGDTELDVRSFAPAQRHHLIFATYEQLAPGTGFVLINDHDPKPLGYQFEAEHPGQYTWDYLEAGPTVWRVRIGRPGA